MKEKSRFDSFWGFCWHRPWWRCEMISNNTNKQRRGGRRSQWLTIHPSFFVLFLLVHIVGKTLEITKKIYETLRNTSALGVIGEIGEVLVKGNYDAMKDDVAITYTKAGKRAKYITKKVVDVARTLRIAKKVTYDATTTKT